MDSKKLERWAQLLLDTGKRNNLINFRDTKASTVEVVCPDAAALYEKCLGTSSFEIYDPKIADDEDDEEAVAAADQTADESSDGTADERLKKKDYIDRYIDILVPFYTAQTEIMHIDSVLHFWYWTVPSNL